MDLFATLNDMSPWWWVALGVFLGAVEMATMSFFLIWPAMAALLCAALLWISPNMSGQLQIATFAVLSVALTFAGRALMARYGDGGEDNTALNARGNLMVGRNAEVISFSGPEGSVSIDGVHWRAVWPRGAMAEQGAKVEIERAEGMVLFVKEPV
jgi:inner membrane protein